MEIDTEQIIEDLKSLKEGGIFLLQVVFVLLLSFILIFEIPGDTDYFPHIIEVVTLIFAYIVSLLVFGYLIILYGKKIKERYTKES